MNARTRPRVVIVRRYGLGQDIFQGAGTDTSSSAVVSESVSPLTSLDSGGPFSPSGAINPGSIGAPITISATAYPTATSTSSGSFNWTSFFNNLVNQAGATARADIAPLSVLPRGSSYFSSPYCTAVSVGRRGESFCIATEPTEHDEFAHGHVADSAGGGRGGSADFNRGQQTVTDGDRYATFEELWIPGQDERDSAMMPNGIPG
jgi:hypothetical protein